MDISLREWLILVGLLVVVAILVHGPAAGCDEVHDRGEQLHPKTAGRRAKRNTSPSSGECNGSICPRLGAARRPCARSLGQLGAATATVTRREG